MSKHDDMTGPATAPAQERKLYQRILLICGIYIVGSALWILWSDLAVERIFPDRDMEHLVQHWKEWGFVVVTGILLYVAMRVSVHNALRMTAAERELAQLQAILHAAIAESRAGIMIADAPDAHIRLCNSAALGLREMPGRVFQSIPPTHDLNQWQTADPDGHPLSTSELPLLRAVRDGEACHGREIVITHPDGQVRHVLANAAPVRNGAGEIIAGVLVSMDITAMRDIQAQAEQHRAQLFEADKFVALGTLVSGVAHEINNPNTAIMLGAADVAASLEVTLPLIRAHTSLPDDRAAAHIRDLEHEAPITLQSILESSRRIKVLVDELKRFAHDASPSMTGIVNLAEVVHSAEALTSTTLRHKNARYQGNVPEAPLHVQGNFQRLEQLVINLLMNAADAVSERDTTVVLTVTGDPDRKEAVLSVRDEGCGMDPETLRHARDPFFTTKRHCGGTGLGLAISMRTAEEHGGALEIESAPDKGTTVTLRLPLLADT